ncbi:MAG: glycosyltransferase, partial [Geodermatophilaceae bacterium]
MSERVTVVIPTRNRSGLLRQTLGTVLAQEDTDFDVVIVDEGSTDETPEMLQRWPHDRLTVLRHEQAKGVSAARNAGLAAATGPWVAFVDDDDIWSPTKLAAQLAAARRTPEAGWVCAGAVRVDSRLRLRGAERTPVPADVGRTLLARNVIPGGASGVLARADLVRQVGGFDETLSNLADYDLWIRLGLAGGMAVVDRPLVGYRVHTAGMAHDVRRSERELTYVEQKYADAREEYGLTVQRERFLWYFGALSLRQGNRVESMRIHR